MQLKSIWASEFIRSIFSNGRLNRADVFMEYLKKHYKTDNQTAYHTGNPGSQTPLPLHHALQRLIFQTVSPGDPNIASLIAKNRHYAKYDQNNATYSPSYRLDMPRQLLDIFKQQNRFKDYLSEDFLKSARKYLGKSYTSLDCYELIVQGMEDLGFRYHGEQGIKEQLMEMAKTGGLPLNTYLIGEGLLEAVGAKICSKRVIPGKHSDRQSRALFESIQPLLKKGYLLSFSTTTRGHVGIVSQHKDQWTFLNSGRMDHSLNGPNQAKGVGEENLKAEIHNWIRFAASKNEPLQVTLGRLDDQKLYAFVKTGARLNKSV